MSFNVTCAIAHDGGDPAVSVHEAWKAGTGPAHQESQGTLDEANELVYGAAAVVKHLVEQLGDRWATAIVSVSGHANPGHVETAGWANDYVQVSVTIATYKAAAT